jgi:hypothetical protein
MSRHIKSASLGRDGPKTETFQSVIQFALLEGRPRAGPHEW